MIIIIMVAILLEEIQVCSSCSMWSQAPKYIHDLLGAQPKVISKLQIGKANFVNVFLLNSLYLNILQFLGRRHGGVV